MNRTSATARIIAVLMAAAVLLAALVSCDRQQEDTRKLLGIQAEFKGDYVTTADYNFTKNDFTVTASYNDYTDEVTEDYGFEVLGISEAYYIIRFTLGEESCYCYVQCKMDVYPSDTNNTD